jgi:adenylosuccinate synthase
LRLDYLIQAIKISGVNKLIINKCDVLEKVGKFKIILDNTTIHQKDLNFDSLNAMKDFIKSYIHQETQDFSEIIFSGDKSKI